MLNLVLTTTYTGKIGAPIRDDAHLTLPKVMPPAKKILTATHERNSEKNRFKIGYFSRKGDE
jgi:hypothetical protein